MTPRGALGLTPGEPKVVETPDFQTPQDEKIANITPGNPKEDDKHDKLEVVPEKNDSDCELQVDLDALQEVSMSESTMQSAIINLDDEIVEMLTKSQSEEGFWD